MGLSMCLLCFLRTVTVEVIVLFNVVICIFTDILTHISVVIVIPTVIDLQFQLLLVQEGRQE
jgi:uncharacterized membrane protein